MISAAGVHRNLLPPRRFWPVTLIGIGVIYNVTGNAAFQISLTLSGLVLTVPITHSTMLWSAAFAGLLILGESITRAVAIGVTLLIASLVFLTAGASSSLPSDGTDSGRGCDIDGDERRRMSYGVSGLRSIAGGWPTD